MRGRLVRGACVAGAAAICGLALAVPGRPAVAARRAGATCPGFGHAAVSTDPRPGALRVFAIQFAQQPADMVSASTYEHAIACVMRYEVAPYLAQGRPNLVVFDEDVGLETLAIGRRGAKARYLLKHGTPSCQGKPFPCETLAGLSPSTAAMARP